MPLQRAPRSLPTAGPAGGRATGLVLAWLLVLVAAWFGAAPAHAAGGALVTSDPGDNQELDRAPGAVTLVFDGKVDAKVAKVVVLDARGANVTAGPLIVEATNVTTQIEDGLPRGTYTVHYRVDGTGDQPRGGAFQFSYGSGSFSPPPDRSWSGSAQEPEVLRGDDPNGPEQSQPAGSVTPGVQVTSSERNDRTTQAPPPTSRQTDPDDPDDPSGGSATGSTDPTGSATTTATRTDPVQRGFLIGGIVLLAAVVGVTAGLYRRSRKGGHQ